MTQPYANNPFKVGDLCEIAGPLHGFQFNKNPSYVVPGAVVEYLNPVFIERTGNCVVILEFLGEDSLTGEKRQYNNILCKFLDIEDKSIFYLRVTPVFRFETFEVAMERAFHSISLFSLKKLND